jgi:flagellin
MRINTNLTALNTFTQYTNNNAKIKSSVEKLSSGSAINNAADNAAGLAISEKMRAQIRGLDKAATNAQDAISLVQTAEGSLNETTEILQRMRELAAQSASDTNEDEIDREALQDEFSQLQEELNDIAKNTTFNKKNLLDGSLSRTTKTLASTDLKNSGMTIDLGNAAAGTYKFSVTTKLESAAVAGRKPTSKELVLGDSATYFSNASVANTVELGTDAAESALLNGNYKLSAEYGDDGNITVTATGDNGQTFEAKINASELENLATAEPSTNSIKLKFNAEADDAFEVTLGLTNNIASTKNNYDTLASNISKISVSVSGGVTAKDAEYGVYANLTGAESVKLEAGMSSVSFSNGVKVNFDTLTSSSVDTQNDAAAISTTVTAPTLATEDASSGVTGGTGLSLNMTAAHGMIADGAFTITDDGAGNLTLKDADGNTWTAGKKTSAAATDQTLTYNFKNSEDPTKSFDVGLTIAGTVSTAEDVIFNKTLTGNATQADLKFTGDDDNGMAAGSTIKFSNMKANDDSSIVNGAGAISISAINGDNITFSFKDVSGASFTSTVAKGSLSLSNADGGTGELNTLTFKDSSGNDSFTIDMTVTNTAGATTNFLNTVDAETSTNTYVKDAGHNYTKIFGTGTDENLTKTTTSKFSVEEKANAGLTFQVGANEGDEMTIFIDKMDSSYLGVASSSVGTREAASAAIGAVDRAINQVSSQRAYLGAIQNRLDHKIANLNTSAENLTSAESQIRDVDMAKEMTEFTNANILAQAATAMLAQANSLPQGVLSLLG